MRNPALELVRGLCAGVVVLTHVRVIPGVLDGLGPFQFLLNWGMEAVVLFFLLSGVAIRLSIDRGRPDWRAFLIARARRILPLYVLAVASGVLVLMLVGTRPTLTQALGHGLFLQALVSDDVQVLASNPPLWSLPYEVVYYLLCAICLHAPRRYWRLWFALALGAALLHHGFRADRSEHALSILAYSAVWLLGFHLPEWRSRLRLGPFASVGLFALAPTVTRLPLGGDHLSAFTYLLFAAFCLPMFLLLERPPSAAAVAFTRGLWVWLLMMALVLGVLWRDGESSELAKYVFTLLAVTVPACTVLLRPVLTQLWQRPQWALRLGRLSYALYLFHFPVFFLASALNFRGASGLILSLALAVSIAVWMEWWVHPALLRVIDRRKPSVARPSH